MAAATHLGSIKNHFRALKDPRVVGRSRHLLLDLIVLAICGVLGNCDDWHDIVLFAQQREAWFRRFLKLPNDIPSIVGCGDGTGEGHPQGSHPPGDFRCLQPGQ